MPTRATMGDGRSQPIGPSFDTMLELGLGPKSEEKPQFLS
jgi:hypothetical protein